MDKAREGRDRQKLLCARLPENAIEHLDLTGHFRVLLASGFRLRSLEVVSEGVD